jgi:hypothetical protein
MIDHTYLKQEQKDTLLLKSMSITKNRYFGFFIVELRFNDYFSSSASNIQGKLLYTNKAGKKARAQDFRYTLL